MLRFEYPLDLQMVTVAQGCRFSSEALAAAMVLIDPKRKLERTRRKCFKLPFPPSPEAHRADTRAQVARAVALPI